MSMCTVCLALDFLFVVHATSDLRHLLSLLLQICAPNGTCLCSQGWSDRDCSLSACPLGNSSLPCHGRGVSSRNGSTIRRTRYVLNQQAKISSVYCSMYNRLGVTSYDVIKMAAALLSGRASRESVSLHRGRVQTNGSGLVYLLTEARVK